MAPCELIDVAEVLDEERIVNLGVHMGLMRNCAGAIAACFLAPCAFGEEAAPDLQDCWSRKIEFSEIQTRMETEGYNKADPSDRIAYLESVLANPEIGCETRIPALYLIAFDQYQNGSPEEYYPVLRRVLSDPLFNSAEAESVTFRTSLVTGAVMYSLFENRVKDGYDLIKDEREILETPFHKDRSIYDFFLAHAGENQLAEDLAKRAFLDAGRKKRLTPAERLVYTGADLDEQARLSSALLTLMMTGAYDSVVENLAGIRVDDSTLGMKILALSAVPKSADPAAALARLGENVAELERSNADGYISPDMARWYYAAHLLALRASAREEEAEELASAALKKLGEDFNPDAEVEAAIRQAVDLEPSDGMIDVQDAELATAVQPEWPFDVVPPARANCQVRFNVSELGRPFNIRALCDDDRFLKSAEDALGRAEFVPKLVNGLPVVRYNILQPLEYRSAVEPPHSRIETHSTQ